jgi:nucleoside-diphosphate-sugar epimerase
MSELPLQVVFDDGRLGLALAERLGDLGHLVRLVRRPDSPGAVPRGVEVVTADLDEASACAKAVFGAQAVYLSLHASGEDRSDAAHARRLLECLPYVAGRARARLVVLDHIQSLAPPGGRRLDEDSPVAPPTSQGQASARAVRRLVEAHRRGEVRAVLARAADLYGPGYEHGLFGGVFWGAALAGKPVAIAVDPETPHTYHHVRDVAASLALLGTVEHDVVGRTFMLPCAPAISTRRLIELLSTALGAPIAVRRIPRAWQAAVGLFNHAAYLASERRYLWDEPLVVDDRKFRSHFSAFVPTPFEEGAAETASWALGRFGSTPAGPALARSGDMARAAFTSK